jgi:CBS domain containing-hemolysin-like protein
LDARISLDDANEKLGLNIQDEEFNTLGGHVFGALGHEPQPGDEIHSDGYTLRIEEADRHRIIKLRLIRHSMGAGSGTGGASKWSSSTKATEKTPKSLEANQI